MTEKNTTAINSTSSATIKDIRDYERIVLKSEQVDIETHHQIHSNIYTRTIFVQKNHIVTGALIKIKTNLIISGDVSIYQDSKFDRFIGYQVLACEAHRKLAFVSHEDTYITMYFKTNSTTVEDAEKEFTDDFNQLLSNRDSAKNITNTNKD